MCDVSSQGSVRSLNLYGAKLPENLDQMDDVDTLNLCYAGLQNLDSILQLQNLRRLFLRYNEISSFEEVEKLKNLPNLESLSLIGNEIYKHPDYREQILSILPQLQVLDGEMLMHHEEDDDDDEKSDVEEDMEGHDADGETDEQEADVSVTLRKPNIVTAMSLLIQELDHLDDIDELTTLLSMRSKKIRENEIFEV
ncbi:Oidioi.mRNA.OKI2018_I69.chr2.g6195.t1.cds [Oikopleura dioica]|uniref:Oidioi.mRNA.OKI2018_I69.chr2.g6195.t1.cds n=1 Tax=Oikopleura dioica TaxID=34765 RepID=A0ABN7T719_OIKDI|nr:Oidioi.mRNA.OKI2018_I69.chr2.g6195.t1.cds [Oikopleura dioica]